MLLAGNITHQAYYCRECGTQVPKTRYRNRNSRAKNYFCSDKCKSRCNRRTYRRAKIVYTTKHCNNCGCEFTVSGKQIKKYCSSGCSYRKRSTIVTRKKRNANVKKQLATPCLVCKKQIEIDKNSKHWKVREFCGAKCRWEAYYMREKGVML